MVNKKIEVILLHLGNEIESLEGLIEMAILKMEFSTIPFYRNKLNAIKEVRTWILNLYLNGGDHN